MVDLKDPQSLCPWCKRTHDAPEFLEVADEIVLLQKEIDRLTGYCASLFWAGEKLPETTLGEIRKVAESVTTKGSGK